MEIVLRDFFIWRNSPHMYNSVFVPEGEKNKRAFNIIISVSSARYDLVSKITKPEPFLLL